MIMDLPFSRLINCRRLPEAGQVINLKANNDECKAIAEALDMLEIKALKAEILLRPRPHSDLIDVIGSFQAEIVAQCVASLESFPLEINEQFQEIYTDRQPPQKSQADRFFDPDAEEIELLDNGSLNIGALVYQYLSLALPDHPRKDEHST
ncbi:MAG: DUF177 domain-containing protein [Alphaproteobacteria bacterium]